MAAAVNSQGAREGELGGSGPLPLLPKFTALPRYQNPQCPPLHPHLPVTRSLQRLAWSREG